MNNTNQLQQVKDIFAILHNEKPADLLIENIEILDVHGESTYKGSLLVYGGKIMALNPEEGKFTVKDRFDGEGLYAIPGLIDAHFHFESQLANPTALAEAMVPCGTTTVFAEFLDLVGSAGQDGVKAAHALFKDYDKLPFRIYAFAPGKKVAADITKELLDMEPVIGLGEFEHFSYAGGSEDDFKKAAWAREKNMFMNSHWGVTTLSDMELNYLPAIGSTNNHDVWNEDDMARSVRYGYTTQIKFGVGSPEVIKTLVRALVKRKFPTENFVLCSDNISVHRLLNQGHMNWIVALCAEMGMSPIKAIKMASYNTARYHHMDNLIGSLTPGRFADVVLTPSLSNIEAKYVFKSGELIAQGGKLLKNADIDYSGMRTQGVPGLANLSADELNVSPLEMSADGTKAKVYLIDVYGRGHAKFYQEVWLPVKNGEIVPEYEGEKLARISVIQRYPKGERHVLNGYFKGVYVNEGAVSTSFPAPTPYLVVIGQNSEEMATCAKMVDSYSGACIVTKNGAAVATLPLEIYGMMADMTLPQLEEGSAAIDAALAAMGNHNVGEPVVNKLLSLFISLHRFRLMKEE